MNGLLLLNKPKGLTSFDVVRQVRRILKIPSVGHTGTLDPMAEGLLVVLVGSYTRACPYLTNKDKTYVAEITFGASTTTDDAEGEVLETKEHFELDEESVKQTLKNFLGNQWQVPPAYSAISIKGERAYAKARRGEAVEIAPRPVCIHSIELISMQNNCLKIRTSVSKGTYIRALARDIGKALKIPAHLSALYRENCGAFNVQNAILEKDWNFICFQENLLQGKKAFLDLPFVILNDDEALQVKQGKKIPVKSLDQKEIYIAFSEKEEPVAFLKQQNNVFDIVRGF